MIQLNELQGAYTALITPMHENGLIDYDKLFQLIDDQIEAGIDGLLACGTTGQSATLKHEEHVNLAERIFQYIGGRTRFIASAGSNCTDESIGLSKGIEDRIGPTTFLHVTGYYNNPPQEGLIDHYNAVADAISDQSNIILYNVPGRTSSNIESATAIALAQNPRIIGIKEASGDLSQVETIINTTDPENFRVLSGEDNIVADISQLGGYGVITASANIAPRYFQNLVETAISGDHETAAELQANINSLVSAVFSAKNPIPLAHMFDTNLRLPLVKLPQIQQQIQETLSDYSSEELGIDIVDYRHKEE